MSKGDVRCHKSSRSVYTVQPVLRMPRRATPTWRLPTSTSRDVSDQAFPVSKCSPPQLSHVNVNRVRGRTGNEAMSYTCRYTMCTCTCGICVGIIIQDQYTQRHLRQLIFPKAASGGIQTHNTLLYIHVHIPRVHMHVHIIVHVQCVH